MRQPLLALALGLGEAQVYGQQVLGRLRLPRARGHAPAPAFEAYIKIRNLHHAAPARVTVRADGQSLQARFAEPQLSVTAGQSAVLYDGDVVLGGGVIL